MKKLLALLLAFAAAVGLLAGCRSEEAAQYPLTVNGTPLDEELFRYYLDIAFADGSLASKEARINYATEQCIRYVAVNSAFKARGLLLTGEQLSEVGERTNALWNIFGEHYGKVGVSRQTFYKLQLSKAYTEELRVTLFGPEGVSPLPEEDLKEYFAAYYVAFKVLRGHLYGTDVYGNRVNYTQDEYKAAMQKYYEAADQINRGVAVDYTYATLISSGNEEVRQSLTTEVIANGDPAYPVGFYNAVRAIPEGRAGALIYGDEVYLVTRVSILADADLFPPFRDACLLAVSEPRLQSEINTMCNAYSSVRQTRAVNRCYEAVRDARGKK